MAEWFTLNFDGGSRGNPGPAAAGAVVYSADGTALATVGRFIGRATNNVAEYKGLITALEQALALGATHVIVRGDSELIIKQMRGEYRVKNLDLKPLHEEAQTLLRRFDQYRLEHNLRGKNVLADKLANLAMDKRRDVVDEDGNTGPTLVSGVSAQPIAKAAPVARKSATPRAEDRWHCRHCGCEIEVGAMSNLPAEELKCFVCVCGQEMVRR